MRTTSFPAVWHVPPSLSGSTSSFRPELVSSIVGHRVVPASGDLTKGVKLAQVDSLATRIKIIFSLL